ncbi:M16 family metallopeptidase [Lysobacter capsici]|uniref:M16 family metallopeptidase n=1 Tax=Lysobacter capsici TaxID=435897 RepID=UPI001C0040F8|nr:pitrilysin family protein [Lysobacter capsici]QWF17778.1 insulinase family protein [Lysobacter capsici]
MALPTAVVAAPRPSTPEAGHEAALPAAPAFTQRTLANGLRVYAIRDTSVSDVAVNLWYDVGGKDDPKNRSGLAHLFEHLMFKSTGNLPAGSFTGLAEDVGGSNDASTEDDYTRYFETVPAAYLERMLFAEADRMAGLVVDAPTLDSERKVVKEEIGTRVRSQAYGRLVQEYLPALSYSRLPYARPAIGRGDDLDAATLDEVRAFHATYYRPDNAVLVVAGHFDPAQLDRWVDRYFAPIPRPDAPIPRVVATEPIRETASRQTVYEPATPLPAVVKSYPLPRDDHADTPALMVLDALLSAGASARLNAHLVQQRSLAQSASTRFERRRLGGYLAVYAILAGEVDVDAGEAALNEEVAKLRDAPVTAQELSRAKNQLLTTALRSRETPDGQAMALGRAVLVDGDANADQRQLVAALAVSAADVQRVANTYLLERRAATLRYLPIDAAPAGIKGDTIAVRPTVVETTLTPAQNLPVVTLAPPGERIALPAAGRPVLPTIPTPVEWRLRNGLRAVLVEKRGLPLLTLSMVTPDGSASDPLGRAGLAELGTALMTQRSAAASADDIAGRVEALGGSLGSGAGLDAASVTLSVGASSRSAAFAILADIVRRPAFAAEDIERARSQALDALDGYGEDPMRLARRIAARAVFGDAPYGRASSGTAASLKAITRDDLAAAHARAWQPARARLVVVGDVSAAQARELAEAAFGDWRVDGVNEASPPQVTSTPKPRVIVVDLPDATQAAIVVARPALARNDPDWYAALVANAALGGGSASRLNAELRYKRALTYDAGSLLSQTRQPGSLIAATLTKPESAASAVELILAELRRLGAEPMDEAELQARKQLVIGEFSRKLGTGAGVAGLIGNHAGQALALSEIGRFIAAVEQVTPQAVQQAARRSFDPNGASIVVVGNARRFADELRKAHPQAESITVDDALR